MKLFYGSQTFFEKPTFGEGNLDNDYGLGFYMTDSEELAELWASQYENGGYILCFEIDTTNLSLLNLEYKQEDDVLKWITILVSHRFSIEDKATYKKEIDWLKDHFSVDLNDVDFVIGYRADDAYFNYSKSFVAGELSFEKLSEAMRVGKLGLQYVAISKEAFSKIRFVSFKKVDYSDKYKVFRKKALEEYQKIKRNDEIKNTFLKDIIRKYE